MNNESGFWTLVIMEMGDDGWYWPGRAWQVANYEDAEADARRWYVGWLKEFGYMDEEYLSASENPAMLVDSMSIDEIQSAIQQLEPSSSNEGDENNQRPYPTALFISNRNPYMSGDA